MQVNALAAEDFGWRRAADVVIDGRAFAVRPAQTGGRGGTGTDGGWETPNESVVYSLYHRGVRANTMECRQEQLGPENTGGRATANCLDAAAQSVRLWDIR